MSYFPKHYIVPNQYTNGGEFVYKGTSTIYIGPYFKTGNGKTFSGNTPQSPNIFEIVPSAVVSLPTQNVEAIQYAFVNDLVDVLGNIFPTLDDFDNIDALNYLQASNQPFKSLPFKYLPQYSPALPTQQDYQNGEFRRYFCKKTNQLLYLEIDQDTYNKLIKRNPIIEWPLYIPFNLPWKLTGTKEQVEQVNRNITEAKIQSLKLYSFNEYLKFDFLKYYKYTEASNLYTAGGEFKTANGQNYIGDYHIHDSKGPMIGKTHTKEPHGNLFLINEAIAPQVINQQSNINQPQSTSSYNPTPMNMGGGSFAGGGGGGGY